MGRRDSVGAPTAMGINGLLYHAKELVPVFGWPCKDYLGDEPDSMSIACTTPANLKCISNGSLLFDRRNDNGTRTARWFVHYPINNYNVTLNIGNYKHIHDEYEAIDGELCYRLIIT
jgi:hypothetical protein